MKNSQSIKLSRTLTLTIVFSMIVAFCAITFVFSGASFAPSAEAEAIAPVFSYDATALDVTNVGEQELVINDDAVFKIESKKGDGLILSAIYAEYTDPTNGKICLAYDDVNDVYTLYAVQGDFTLVGEWVAETFTPVWNCDTSKGTITSETPSVVQFGIGLPLESMPSVDGIQGSSSMYYSDGWSVTGTLQGGSSYSLGYIPENAISATCTAKLTDGSTHVYYTTADVNDDTRENVVGEGTFNTDKNKSNGTPIGVYAAGDTTDPYSGIDCTVNTNGTKYRFGFLGHKSNNGSGRPYNKRLDAGCDSTFTNDAGATEYYNGMGFYREKTSRSSTAIYDHSMLIIPVRFDNALKRDLLAGAYSTVRVTVTARILVGAKHVTTSVGARTNAWLNLEEGIKTRLSNFSYSENSASVDGYPRSYIDGKWQDNFSHENGDSKNPCTITSGYIKSTTWGVQQGKYTKTIQTSATSGFTIGFRATYYSQSGGATTKHFALINALTYTIEAIDAEGNPTAKQLYTVNLDSNNQSGAPTDVGAKENSQISATSFDSALTVANAPWAINGYTFTGWHTAPELQEGETAITDLTGTAEGTTYYAIWEKKKYPYVVYDSFTDGTNYARVHREYSVFEHGAQNLVEPNADGGGDYVGFSDPIMRGSVMNGGASVVAFERTLLAPTVDSITGASVVYGTPIDLDACVSASHASANAILTNNWKTTADEDVVFSGEDHVIYNAPESGEYKVVVTASVDIANTVRGNKTLTSSATSEAKLYEIQKIELALSWTLDGEDAFTIPYDGEEHTIQVAPSGMINGESAMVNLTENVATNAGTYLAQATLGEDVINYSLPENDTQAYEITKVQLTLDWKLDGGDEFTVPYNGLERVVTAEAVGLIGEDSVTINLTDNVAKNANRYLAQATLGEDVINYSLSEDASQVYEIERFVIELEWALDGESELVVPYNGLERVVTVSPVETPNDEIVTINVADGVGKNVGTYTAKATLSSADSLNYELTDVNTIDFEITKATLSLEWKLDGARAFAVPYNGLNREVIATIGGIANNESIALNYTDNVAKNVGEYVATAEFVESELLANYVLPTNLTQEYTIEKVALTLTWALDGTDVFNLTYDGSEHAITATLSGMVNDEDIVVTLDKTSLKGAGTHTIEATIVDSAILANYVLPENLTQECVVAKTALSLTWALDGTDVFNVIYDGVEHVITATLGGLLDGDSVVINLANDKQTDAGEYVATAEFVEDEVSDNYELPTNLTQDYAIGKKAIDGTGVWQVTVDENTSEYTNETILKYANKVYTLTTTLDETAIVTREGIKDVINLVYTNNAKTDKGEYVASVAIDNSNYELVENKEFAWEIVAKEVTLTWMLADSSTLTKEYDGTEAEITVSLGGIIDGTICEVVTIVGNKGTDANEYVAEVTTISNANYVLPAVASQAWSITARPIVLEWTGAGFTYSGSEQGVSAVITNLVGGDVCELGYVNNQKTNAGDYQAEAVSVSNTNYTLVGGSNATYDWSIAKKEITLVWALNNASELNVVYNAFYRNLTVKAEGLVGEDEVMLSTGGVLMATDVGNYEAFVTAVDNANYALPSESSVSWSISALPVIVEWTGDGFIYDGNTHEVTAKIKNVASGDVVEFDCANNERINAGTYLAEISNLSNSNYTLDGATGVTCEWEIAKRVVALEWAIDGNVGKTSVIYDGNAHEATASVTNAVNEDVVLVTAYENNVNTEIATYVTLAKEISDTDNYALPEDATFTWNIQIEGLTVTITTDSFVYNGQNQGITAIISGMSASDVNELVVLTEGTTADSVSQEVKDGKIYVYYASLNAGSYVATLSGLDGAKKDNYTLPATSESFEITARTVEISWTANGGVYAKENIYATASVTNKALDTDEIAFEYTTTATDYSVSGTNGIGNVAMNVGEYLTTIISIVDNDNYTLTSATNTSVEWAITAKKVTEFTWSNNSFTYANTAYVLTAEALTGGANELDGKLYDGDVLTISYQGTVKANYGVSEIAQNEATNAGEYEVSIASIGNANYYVESVSSDFVIAKAVVALNSTSNWTKTYDKSNAYSSYEYQAIENTELEVSATYAGANAGEVALTFVKSGLDADNYVLVLEGLEEGVQYAVNGNEYVVNAGVANILRKRVTAIGNGEKVFDGTKETNAYIVDATEIMDGDAIIVTASYDDENVGARIITLAIDNSNYELTSSSVDGEIIAKDVTLNWTNAGAEYVYNGEEQGVSVSTAGMVEGYEEELIVTGEFTAVGYGNYSVSVSLDSASNYTIDGQVASASWTINKKELSVLWSEANSFNYDASEKTYMPELVGIIDGDIVEMNVSGTNATIAGTYTARVDGIKGADANNYTLATEVSEEWIIAKVDIVGITFTGAEYIYDGNEKNIEISSLKTQFEEDLVVVYTGAEDGNKATNAGEYQVVATIEESTNYNALTLTATLVITPAQIEVTMAGGSFSYDGNVHSLEIETLVTGATATYELVGTTLVGNEVRESANGTKKAGSYVVTATITAGANYQEKVVSATLEITAKALVFTWQAFANEGIYNGAEQGFSFLAEGAVAGDDVSVAMVLTNEFGSENVSIAVGTEFSKGYINASEEEYVYSVQALVGTDAYNYTLPENLDNSVTIAKRTIQVIGWNDGVKDYALGATIAIEYARQNVAINPIFDASVIDGDIVDFVVTNNEEMNAGSYEMSVALVDNINYAMATVTKTWEITPKELSVEWQGKTDVTYNGKAHELIALVTGIIDGDTIKITYQNNNGKNAGSYQVKISSIGNNNYKIADSKKTKKLVIKPANIEGIELPNGEYLEDGEEYTLALNKLLTQFGDKVSFTMVTKDKNGKVVNNKVKKAGEYDVWVTIECGDNYQERTIQAKLIIKAKRLEETKEDKENENNGNKKGDVNVESAEGFAPGTEIKAEYKEYSLREMPVVNATLNNGERVAMVYDVRMLYKGQNIDPAGVVTVKMQVPEKLEEAEFRLVGIVDGKEVELEYVIEDGYVVVETDKLESFVFVYEPTTSDYVEEFLVIIIICAIALLLLIIGSIVLSILMKKHEITFVTGDLELAGGDVGAIKVRRGMRNVSLPEPIVTGMYYDGWYSDENYTNVANPAKAQGKQLFAKPVKENSRKKNKVPASLTDNMEFKGWYMDPECTEKANVKKLGRKDVTLYAKWGSKRRKPVSRIERSYDK